MKTMDELHLNRCNVQVEDEVKSWYMYKAKSMGMSMSQLMAFVLANWYEQHINSEAVRLIAELNQGEDIKEINGNAVELLSTLKSVYEMSQNQLTDNSKNGNS